MFEFFLIALAVVGGIGFMALLLFGVFALAYVVVNALYDVGLMD